MGRDPSWPMFMQGSRDVAGEREKKAIITKQLLRNDM